MNIGLIDVDSHNFPNLPLMKISAWHKAQGDNVEWYTFFTETHYDIVYVSKVFSFSQDYEYPIIADKVVYGGSGYCIELVDGKEVYHKERDKNLPYEVEHIYPDYSLYPALTKDTAYGFLSRGCPRGCDFCHVKDKEGRCSYKVADLSEFWRGQKFIVLNDPNILACKDWRDLLNQLVESKAWIDFNQGIDIRLIDDEKMELLNQIKVKTYHFAWDKYEDKEVILPKFKFFREHSTKNWRDLFVYVLCNFNTTFEQDLERINTLREIGFNPYVMLYDKEHIPKGNELLKLQRYVNNKFIFPSCTWEEYQKSGVNGS